MKSILNLSTRWKLILSFGLMLALLAAVVVTAYNGIAAIRNSQATLFHTEFAIVENMLALRADLTRQRASIQQMMLTTNRAEQQTIEREIKQNTQDADGIMQLLSDQGQDKPDFLQRLGELKTLRQEHRATREIQIQHIYNGELEQALELGLGIQTERYEKIRAIGVGLTDAAKERARASLQAAEQRSRQSLRFFSLVCGLAVLLVIAIVWFLDQAIANPLKELSAIAAQIATGDLSVNIAPDRRRDEVGVLRQNFGRMTQSLGRTAGVARQIAGGDLTVKVTPLSDQDALGNAFATMVENVRRTTAEITEGVNILATSASQISASTAQVAAAAAETATAVTETTATVEEVKQTAQVASQKARHVADSAQKSTQIAQSGKRAVEVSLEGMHRIQAQMQSIAESIVKLSEQSQAIGEIIAAVNDLTEQSNLLAVNAAIEAARAGEHGRGFGVVAQEIKSLAEQSKQATAQIRGILNEIQKATSAAVMTTEQGSKAVEAGTKQSAEAGESIRLLADSIMEASQAATQIAASSQQQLVGMDQVAMAMDNIKQASTQNVAGTKQSETAAHNLQELGQRLKRLVEQYKV